MTTLTRIQEKVGVAADGRWGPATAAAVWKALGGEPVSGLTVRGTLELLSHEALILEAYKDSEGVWTWAGGLTGASGIDVLRYKDKPSTLAEAVAATVERIESKYLPEVLAAFKGRQLPEHQLAAALSFHWNTGAIGKASWVQSVLAGRSGNAEAEIMNWRTPPEIVERRRKERDLFFHGLWSGDGKVNTYAVNKPSYTPKWSSAKRVDVSGIVREAMA